MAFSSLGIMLNGPAARLNWEPLAMTPGARRCRAQIAYSKPCCARRVCPHLRLRQCQPHHNCKLGAQEVPCQRPRVIRGGRNKPPLCIWSLHGLSERSGTLAFERRRSHTGESVRQAAEGSRLGLICYIRCWEEASHRNS